MISHFSFCCPCLCSEYSSYTPNKANIRLRNDYTQVILYTFDQNTTGSGSCCHQEDCWINWDVLSCENALTVQLLIAFGYNEYLKIGGKCHPFKEMRLLFHNPLPDPITLVFIIIFFLTFWAHLSSIAWSHLSRINSVNSVPT